MHVVWLSVLKHLSMIFVVRSKSITKVRVQQSSISIEVISSHESVYVVSVTKLSVVLKDILQIRRSNKTFLLGIKHLECISKIEVSHLSKSDLCLFHFSFVDYDIFEHCDEFVLLVKVEWTDFRQMSFNRRHCCNVSSVIHHKRGCVSINKSILISEVMVCGISKLQSFFFGGGTLH